jgi:acyl-CoA reductase-like NAD-dependent aldehyde dehydrogenase
MATASMLANFINGEFVKVECEKYAQVINPAIGEVIANVPLSSSTDLDVAVKAAQVNYENN